MDLQNEVAHEELEYAFELIPAYKLKISQQTKDREQLRQSLLVTRKKRIALERKMSMCESDNARYYEDFNQKFEEGMNKT